MQETNNLIDIFLKFEEDNQLFEHSYNGFNYWIYIRFDIYSKIFETVNNSSPINLKFKHNKKHLTKRIYNIISSYFHQPREIKKLMILQHPRKIYIDEYYQDIYTNFLAEEFKDEITLFDRKSPVYYSPQKYKYFKDDITVLWSLWYKLTYKTNYKEDIFLENIQKEIEYLYSITLPKNFIIKLVQSRHILYKSYSKFYTQILNRISPKCIVEIVYYNPINMIVNEIAYNKGIATIELQHGTMGQSHIAYNFKNSNHIYKQFPSEIFLFSEYWKNTSHIPLPSNKIKITGFPYFEEQQKKIKVNKTKEKINILFISQTTIGLELSKFAAQLSEIIDLSKYSITYKFHPAEYLNWPDRMPWLYSKRNVINIIENTNITLYNLFSDSDIQIGVYSTGIYEGLGFNLETFIVTLPGWEGMKPLIDGCYAQKVNNPNELLKALGEKIDSEKYQDNHFWKKDAKENIIKEIKKRIL